MDNIEESNNQQSDSNIIKELYIKHLTSKLRTTLKPVYNKCSNERCFCSGNCKKIIGWEDIDGTITYIKGGSLFDTTDTNTIYQEYSDKKDIRI